MKPNRAFRSLLPAAMAVIPWSTVSGAVVYTENFAPVFDTNPKSFGSVGWNAHLGSGAVDRSSVTTSPYIVTTTAGVGGNSGIGARVASSEIGIAWTAEFAPIDLSVVAGISYYSNNNETSDLSRIAIQIDTGVGTAWYVTNQTFGRDSATAGNGSNFGANAEIESIVFANAAGAWRVLNFTPGTGLALGAETTSVLPSGNLVGVGIFNETSAGTLRFDNFQIETVPEMSSALALAVGLGGFAWSRRRSRDR